MTILSTTRALPLFVILISTTLCNSFVPTSNNERLGTITSSLSATPVAASDNAELQAQKKKLMSLLQTGTPSEDPILADPITKEGISIVTKTTMLGGVGGGSRANYELTSPSNTYAGTSDTFYNLLEPVQPETSKSSGSSSTREERQASLVRNMVPFIPPPLRSALATAGLDMGDEYVPMRDLFTSPAVSYAYERGWRQGFSQAGFPGADVECEMAMDYFAPAMALDSTKVLVDMSCATGLFTRRFAKSGQYKRVLGCDYSASMLQEARRRISADAELRNLPNTRLELVRLDVGQIPMKTASLDALHAGAAMHCWPDLPTAATEIYRVLKPGGRYFATTFLSSYFGMLQSSEGGATGPSRQAFNYFASTEQLRSLMQEGGFAPEKIFIEVLGSACVIIRCEK